MLVISASAAGSARADELERVRTAWRMAETEEDYFQAAKDLKIYREGRFAKTPEVDYMIASALCRVPDFVSAGRRHFNWILNSYQVGDSYDTILREMDRCGRSDIPTDVSFNVQFGQGGAGKSEVRLKLYYWLGRENAAINTEPIEIVDPRSPEELLGRLYVAASADRAREAAEERLTVRAQVISTSSFVVADTGDHSRGELERVGQKLEKFLAFFRDAYRLRAPEHLITVYLVPSVDELAAVAEELHGLRIPAQSIGYSFKDDLSILGVVRDARMGTLAHELFHMMVRDQYGDLPPWLDEGTAALYEVSNTADKYLPDRPADIGSQGAPIVGGELAVRGRENWRSCVLRKFWIERFGSEIELPSLRTLVTMDWRAFNSLEGGELVAQQAVNHATARYFILFLQDETDKLFSVFESFAKRDPFEIAATPDDDTLSRLQAELGDLDLLNTRFQAWLEQVISERNC
ncbi:hypothetical protein [Pelagibius sp. Alg239-R121]|uniref:hypothetical protein n=1 Tax=Pelagibius sp. Alg239-R121 TaxID=2993448 RepID=UPI0024A624B4|nr:hypothetical protein [Pelagibius sp. Alg239-R121]